MGEGLALWRRCRCYGGGVGAAAVELVRWRWGWFSGEVRVMVWRRGAANVRKGLAGGKLVSLE